MVLLACQVPILQKDNELPKERGNLLVGQLWKCHIQTLLAGGSTGVTRDSLEPVYKESRKLPEVLDKVSELRFWSLLKNKITAQNHQKYNKNNQTSKPHVHKSIFPGAPTFSCSQTMFCYFCVSAQPPRVRLSNYLSLGNCLQSWHLSFSFICKWQLVHIKQVALIILTVFHRKWTFKKDYIKV